MRKKALAIDRGLEHFSKLSAIFKETLEIDSFTIDVKLGDIPEWDSLRHFEIIQAVEGEFQIRFLCAEIEEVISFKKLSTTIMRKLEEKAACQTQCQESN